MNETLKKQIMAALETLEWSYKDPYVQEEVRDETVQDLEREVLYLNELKEEIERADCLG